MQFQVGDFKRWNENTNLKNIGHQDHDMDKSAVWLSGNDEVGYRTGEWNFI